LLAAFFAVSGEYPAATAAYSFILKKALGPLSIKLYEGSQIMQLKTREPCACIAEGWTKVQEHLVNVT
jgi:hypothetical protein